MKLELTKDWFDKSLPHDNPETGAGRPDSLDESEVAAAHRDGAGRKNEMIERIAFGALIRLLRREHHLSVERLAAALQLAAPELSRIERDPACVVEPDTVTRLSRYFDLPVRPLLELASEQIATTSSLRVATKLFPAQATVDQELTAEERTALTEFVRILSSQPAEPA